MRWNRHIIFLLVWSLALAGCAGEDPISEGGDTGAEGDGSASCSAPDTIPTGAVFTKSGVVQGVEEDGVLAFLGIPYAASPVGELRWKAPAPYGCWEDVLQTSSFGPACPQPDDDGVIFGEEDCLHLNIWAPAEPPEEPLPVMVYIHGGGHFRGLSGQKREVLYSYHGGYIAKTAPAIVVTFNYRLGALGFLALEELTSESEHGSSGNYGFQDQIHLLRWVQDNIAAFGGDPTRVMVFGNHSGASDVTALIASPEAKDLFHGAVLQSGRYGLRSLAEGELFGEKVVAETTCADSAERMTCLRGLSAVDLVSAKPGFVDFGTLELNDGGEAIYYELHTDDWLLFDDPRVIIANGEHTEMPIIVGSNAEETAMEIAFSFSGEGAYEIAVQNMFSFADDATLAEILSIYPADEYPSPKDALIAMTTEFRFTFRAWGFAKAAAEGQEAPVYWYLFDHDSTLPSGVVPAGHGSEILYVFGLFSQIYDIFDPVAADLALMEIIIDYWSNLAAEGDPNGDGLVVWEPFETERKNALRLSEDVEMVEGLCIGCEFWESYAKSFPTW